MGDYKIILMFKEDWIKLQSLITTKELDDAEVFVKKMHQSYHTYGILHARIHFAWSKIAWLKQTYLWSIGQWIAGAIFAIPVSYLANIFLRNNNK